MLVLGPLAQSVEHRPFKAVVGGSNPARLIKDTAYSVICVIYAISGVEKIKIV